VKFTGFAPVLVVATLITPGTGALTATGSAPTLQSSGGMTIIPPSGSLGFQGIVSLVSRGTSFIPAAVKTQTDYGDRANEDPLSDGGKWIKYNDATAYNLKLVNGEFVHTQGAGSVAAMYRSGTLGVNQFSQAIIAQKADSIVAARVSSDNFSDYELNVLATELRIYKVTNGSGSQKASVAFTANVGDVARIECIGTNPTTINGYVNGILKITYVDSVSPLESGYVGLGMFGITSKWDGWNGGDLTGIVFTGYAPILKRDTPRTPQPENVAFTGYAPTLLISSSTSITPPAGSLSLQGAAPWNDIAIRPPPGDLAFAGYAPTLQTSAGATITPPAGLLSASGIAPQLLQNNRITPAAGGIDLQGIAPQALKDNRITPAAGSLAFLGFAPRNDRAIRPLAGSMSIEGYAPTVVIQGATNITPPVGALSIIGYPPTVSVSGNSEITPGAGQLGLQGATPRNDIGIRGSPGALFASGAAPRLDLAIRPLVGSLLAQGVAPRNDRGVLGVAGSLGLTGYAPTLDAQANRYVTPPAGALGFIGIAPEIAIMGEGSIMPTAGQLSLIGYAPTVTISGISITPPAGQLAFTGIAGRNDRGIIPSVGALVLAGNAPILSRGTLLTPGAGSLLFDGIESPLLFGTVIVPGTGYLFFDGQNPVMLPRASKIVFRFIKRRSVFLL